MNIKYEIDAKELCTTTDDDNNNKTQNVSNTCNRLLLVYDYKLIQLCSIAHGSSWNSEFGLHVDIVLVSSSLCKRVIFFFPLYNIIICFSNEMRLHAV